MVRRLCLLSTGRIQRRCVAPVRSCLPVGLSADVIVTQSRGSSNWHAVAPCCTSSNACATWGVGGVGPVHSAHLCSRRAYGNAPNRVRPGEVVHEAVWQQTEREASAILILAVVIGVPLWLFVLASNEEERRRSELELWALKQRLEKDEHADWDVDEDWLDPPPPDEGTERKEGGAVRTETARGTELNRAVNADALTSFYSGHRSDQSEDDTAGQRNDQLEVNPVENEERESEAQQTVENEAVPATLSTNEDKKEEVDGEGRRSL